MRNICLKYSLYALLALSAIAFFALAITQNITVVNFVSIFKLIPKVVSIDLLAVAAFSSFMWKWRIFKGWLVPFPNLNGTWKGSIQSTWVDPITNERAPAIPAILTIKQSFLKISCVMRTTEMTSRSIIADFVLDKEQQVCRVSYTYDSNPIATVKERSPQHLGTMLFDIVEAPERKLEGDYWTGRKTTGHVELTFWKKELLHKYPNDMWEC